MTDFTTIMDRGHRKFIDKHMKKRNFGACDNCEDFNLLIQATLKVKKNTKYDEMEIKVCETCYNILLFGSKK